MALPWGPKPPREGFGTIIAIIGKGMELTLEEAMEVYQVSNDHKYIKNFMKPIKVDRFVIKRDDSGSHLIVPTSKLALKIIEHI